jgi:hypothetical protein
MTPGSVSYSDGSGGSGTASVDFASAHVHAYSSCGNVINCAVNARADFSDAITIFGTTGFLEANIQSTSVAFFGTGEANTDYQFGSFSGISSNGFLNGNFSYQVSFTGWHQGVIFWNSLSFCK